MPSQAVPPANYTAAWRRNATSDLTAIVLMLLVFVFASFTATFYLGRVYRRCDDILTGGPTRLNRRGLNKEEQIFPG